MEASDDRGALITTLRAVERQKSESPLGRAMRAAEMANSYSRLGTVVRHFSSLPRFDWFRLLGEQWSTCDNIAAYRPVLRSILANASRAELDAMMTAQEGMAWAELPAVLTIYRGCYRRNFPGLSWTLDRATAERFPSLTRYRRDDEQPFLRIGQIARERAVLKLDREECEIITAGCVRYVSSEPLTLLPLR